MEHNTLALICRHKHCGTAQYNDDRHVFKSAGIRTKHEKNRNAHLQCCMDRESCETCKKHKFAPTKLPSKKKYRCRHSECQKMYKRAKDRWDHERDHMHDRVRCIRGDCQTCKKFQIKDQIPEEVATTITGVKRKLDEADPDIYVNIPLHKKQKLIAEADCAVVVTSADGIPTVVTLSREEIERLRLAQKEPDINKLLAIKDDLCIPDSKWSAVVEVFHLSDKCTLYQIRKRREIVDGTMGPITRTKGNGRQQELKQVLAWMLKKEQINPDIPVRIKFAFDGARITLKQKQTQVVGTVEILSGKNIAQAKSPSNAHQWIIYLGSESNENLKKELIDSLPTIQQIFDDKSVSLTWIRSAPDLDQRTTIFLR
jgi:hypothetical protein